MDSCDLCTYILGLLQESNRTSIRNEYAETNDWLVPNH